MMDWWGGPGLAAMRQLIAHLTIERDDLRRRVEALEAELAELKAEKS